METGKSCWRIETATRAAFVVDAEEYFRVCRAAMLKARKRIMLIGWDFDARIELEGAKRDGGPPTVGDFIFWLVENNPELEVFLLRWDTGALKAIFRGTTVLTLIKWMRHPRIHTKLDGCHPTGGSHHQKIVVIDDSFAFCGGIDMTGDRWDTRAHKDDDPGRIEPDGDPYGPWHDATCALDGPVAGALGKLARLRWRRATGETLAPVTLVNDCWPDELEADFENVEVAISRTDPEMDDRPGVFEIENLFVEQIAAARHTIYSESQYFASRVVAEAIAKRLDEPDCPEIVMVQPLTAEGWLEPIAMDSARARIVETLRRRDRHGRLRIYHPHTKGGEPIYVHAKVTVIDDCVFRVGSANLNNRSMRLDSECDVTIDASIGDNARAAGNISKLRNELIAEHLDIAPETVAAAIDETGSLIAALDRLASDRLRPYETPNLSEVEEWLADNKILDPEGPGEMFEPTCFRRSLIRRLIRR